VTFEYELPRDRIAQRPVYPYDQARLLVVNRECYLFEIRFFELDKILSDKDLLVFNDTKVLKARLFGMLESGTRVEVMLERKLAEDRWLVFGAPMKKFQLGKIIIFSPSFSAVVEEKINSKNAVLRFIGKDDVGTMPIPPYIRDGKGDEQDLRDYQTIFAKNDGSIAAPTASLHFTEDLMRRLKEKGVSFGFLTLHVGASSIFPVYDKPGSENFVVPEETIELVNRTKEKGGRVIAVGTTSCRALESYGQKEGETDLFITPGYKFRFVDCLITNFHQPGTTHLLLVEALLGRESLEKSYKYALENDFRFLSYGDAMIIV
jgi:S-adenosylmethionine:tRNA ribosyltransferase-isomerase